MKTRFVLDDKLLSLLGKNGKNPDNYIEVDELPEVGEENTVYHLKPLLPEWKFGNVLVSNKFLSELESDYIYNRMHCKASNMNDLSSVNCLSEAFTLYQLPRKILNKEALTNSILMDLKNKHLITMFIQCENEIYFVDDNLNINLIATNPYYCTVEEMMGYVSDSDSVPIENIPEGYDAIVFKCDSLTENILTNNTLYNEQFSTQIPNIILRDVGEEPLLANNSGVRGAEVYLLKMIKQLLAQYFESQNESGSGMVLSVGLQVWLMNYIFNYTYCLKDLSELNTVDAPLDFNSMPENMSWMIENNKIRVPRIPKLFAKFVTLELLANNSEPTEFLVNYMNETMLELKEFATCSTLYSEEEALTSGRVDLSILMGANNIETVLQNDENLVLSSLGFFLVIMLGTELFNQDDKNIITNIIQPDTFGNRFYCKYKEYHGLPAIVDNLNNTKQDLTETSKELNDYKRVINTNKFILEESPENVDITLMDRLPNNYFKNVRKKIKSLTLRIPEKNADILNLYKVDLEKSYSSAAGLWRLFYGTYNIFTNSYYYDYYLPTSTSTSACYKWTRNDELDTKLDNFREVNIIDSKYVLRGLLKQLDCGESGMFTINLCKQIEFIGIDAFDLLYDKLIKINYEGTFEEWQKIKIECMSSKITTFQLQCSDGNYVIDAYGKPYQTVHTITLVDTNLNRTDVFICPNNSTYANKIKSYVNYQDGKYLFDKWYLDEAFTQPATSNDYYEDKTLYAKWDEACLITVYKTNSDTVSSTTLHKKGNAILKTLPEITDLYGLSGYAVKDSNDWGIYEEDLTFKANYTTSYVTSTDIIIRPNWKKCYNIRFAKISSGHHELYTRKDAYVRYPLPIIIEDDYQINSWKNTSDLTLVTSDVTLKPNYVRRAVNISYENDILEEEVYKIGDTPIEKERITTKLYHTLQGWDSVNGNFDFTQPVTESVRLAPRFTPDKLPVYWKHNDGTLIRTSSATYGQKEIIPPSYTSAPGYSSIMYHQWYYDEALTNKANTIYTWVNGSRRDVIDKYMPGPSITLYGHSTLINYNITYNLNDGILEEMNPETYNVKSDNITLINPTKEGYTFTGWTGTDLKNKTLEVTIPTGSIGNRTYTANWEVTETIEEATE